MKKDILSVLAILILLCCGAACTESAEKEAFVCGDYKYVVLEDGSAEIEEYTGNAGRLKIP